MKRTDLICESAEINSGAGTASVHDGELYGTPYTETVVSEQSGNIAPGRYITLFTEKGDIRRSLTSFLKQFIPPGSVLVAGLGNENICSDSLGTRALRFIPATAHLSGHPEFSELGMRSVWVIEAGVTGKTGMESSSRIACTAGYVGAGAVIAIDSLACAEINRLCTTIQLTDTGIAPGSGVGNDRRALNRQTAGVPVIAIGVPTVIDLDSVTGDSTGSGLMVSPRNIDLLVSEFAEIIGISVSRALNPGLSEKEIRSLILK